MRFPKDVEGDPVAMLAYAIGSAGCPSSPKFQVCDDDGNPFPIYEMITPNGCGVDVGRDALLEAALIAVAEIEKRGFKIVKAE